MGAKPFSHQPTLSYVIFEKLNSFSALLILSTFAMAGCQRPSEDLSNVKTIATDISPSGSHTTFLYFREGAKIVRTRCPEGELGRTRDRCPLDRKEVDANWFLAHLGTGVGTALPQLDVLEKELYIRLGDIDQRLIEIVSTGVDPTTIANLQQRLRDAEAQIAVVEIDIRQLDIQIGALEAEIARASTADLLVQLTLVRSQRGTKSQTLVTLKNNLAALRKEYVDVHGSSLSSSTYRNLITRRGELTRQLTDTLAKIDLELNRVVALQAVIEMLEDQRFTTEVIRASASFANEKEFVGKFEELFGGPPAGTQECEGLRVPGDYADLAQAYHAISSTGGNICLQAGDFSAPSGFSLRSIMPQGNGLNWRIAGSGMNETTIGAIEFNMGSCKNCTFAIENLTIKYRFSPSVPKDGSTISIKRVRSYGYFSSMPYEYGTLDIDASDFRGGSSVTCASGIKPANVRISNSNFRGSTSTNAPASALTITSSNGFSVTCGATIIVVNNTFSQGHIGFKTADKVNVSFYNNLVVGNTTGLEFQYSTGITHSNNALFGNTANYAGQAQPGANYFSGTGLGVNVATDPPSLQANSPLRAVGLAAGAPMTDFYGKVRDNGIDIGAVQY